MKIFSALLILVFTSQSVAYTQPCLLYGNTFETQGQIDNFQQNYPGCTFIIGYVRIIGTDITNLDGLNVLESIGEGLEIKSTSLQSLTGLNNLTSVYGPLLIKHNDSLTSIQGLDNLTSIGQDLVIKDNDVLTSLIGLDSLISIQRDFHIQENNALVQGKRI